MSCGCNKMVGGSLASDMVMETVKGQHDEPYDFMPAAECGDVSAYKGVSQTAGGWAKSMIKRHKKIMHHSKKHTKKNSHSKRHSKKHTKKHSHSKRQSHNSHRRHSKKTHKTIMKIPATPFQKSQKIVVPVIEMPKMPKIKVPSIKMPKMMGGGSDWISSQYSQGPLNDNSDFSGQFSVSSSSPKNMLRNPPNLASAGSGAPMDFFGAGSPL